MSATFDATTTGEYSAATTAAARSAVIVAALTGTISVKVFNGSNTEMGSGTMAAPWATASGDTVLIGEVSSFTVGTTATPDSNWYIRFQNAGATRWVRGSFGLAGSGQDFTWSLDNWTATHTGTIGTATIITSGNAAPAFTVAPTSRSLPSSGGTIQFTAVDPEGVAVTYSMSTRTGFSINATTGLVTVTSAAAGSTGNITVTASDGVLSTPTVCAVTVAAASGATFTIPTNIATYNAGAVQPGDTIVILRGSGTRGPLKIQNLNPVGSPVTIRTDPAGQVIMRSSATSSGGYIFHLENCHNFEFDGSTSGVTYGLKVMYSSATNPGRPTAFVQFSGSTDDFEMHHVHVDGGFPAQASGSPAIGMQYNDHAINLGSGLFNDGIEIHHCLIENIATEGMYIGPNWVDGDRPLKNVQIHHNTLDNVGWDGIQGKAWWEGSNAIYNNTLTDCGNRLSETQAQLCGISVLSGPVAIYNNTVIGAGQQGIQAFTSSGPPDGYSANGYGPYNTFVAYIYNNVVVDSGQQNGSIAGTGITLGQTAGTVDVQGFVYSNTVVNCNGTSITNNGGAAGGFTKNNICAGNTANTPTGATQTANTVSTDPSSLFVAPESNNYHLLAETAAVTGSIGVDYSSTDIDGTSRAGTASRGAYEKS